MAKERFLTVMVPIKDEDCEPQVFATLSDLVNSVPPSLDNINKIYRLADGSYRRVWEPTSGIFTYHRVYDREFPYLGDPLEIFDFTYSATRMGSAPTISAQGVMRYAYASGSTLDGLWTQECHVVFNGSKFHLRQIPDSSKSNEDARYKYDMDFIDESVVLESVYFYDVVQPFINEKPVSENSVFSFYGDINELVKRINASLIRSGLASLVRKYVGYPTSPSNIVPYLTYEQWTMMNVNPSSLIGVVFANGGEMQVFGQSIYAALHGDYNRYLLEYIYENDNGECTVVGYKCVIGKDKYGDLSSSEEKLLSFDNNTIHEALQQFHDTFELEYYIVKEKDSSGSFTGNTLIMVADCEHDFADIDPLTGDFVRDDEGIPTTDNPFDYGVNDELLSKTKTNTTDKIVTRITGVGSSENIPWYYPNPCPDGWIKPILTRKGVALQDAVINYPTDEGSTTEDYIRYEKYLKNRIGVPIKKGILKHISYGTSYDYKGSAQPHSPNPWPVFVQYYISETKDMTLGAPSMTLYLDYHQQQSGCSSFSAKLYRGPFMKNAYGKYVWGVLVSEYKSWETYSTPDEFQTMMINKDGEDITNSPLLIGGYSYLLEIQYNIPYNSIPVVDWFDYEGYRYTAQTITNQNVPSTYTDPQTGLTHYYHAFNAYVGENFYAYNDLVPFAVFGDTVVMGQNDRVDHYLYPTDAGYGVVNGNETEKVSPIPRQIGMLYKDITSGVIYECKTSDANNIQTGQPTTVFSENPLISASSWINKFVDMKLSVYQNDGWYINGKKVNLNDYGGIWPVNGQGITYNTDIFDAIEFQRLKWVTPLPNLMPEVFIKTDGERRFYNAHNYWDKKNSVMFEGIADTAIGEQQVGTFVRNPLYKEEETDTDDKHYDFENEYIQQLPHEHIENFDDVKPSIKGQINYVAVVVDKLVIDDWANQYQNYFIQDENGNFVQATSVYDYNETYYIRLRIDVVEEFAYDTYDDNEIWESGDNNGEYKHPYFFAKLRPLGFNIFDLALQEDMVISMTTGNCGACNFRIGVDENYRKNPVQLWEYDVYRGDMLATATKVFNRGDLRRYTNLIGLYYNTNNQQSGYTPVEAGLGVIEGSSPAYYESNIAVFRRYQYTGESVEKGLVGTTKQNGKNHFEGDVVTNGKFIESQQDTTDNYVWVALFKDTDSYGTLMPSSIPNYNDPTLNQYIRPKSIADVHDDYSTGEQDEENADKFVLTNIRLPQIYLRRAEHELSRKLVNYMYEHNYQKFNFSIKFSRIYVEENPNTDDNLNENSVLYVSYNNATYRQYVKSYTYTMKHDETLPELNVDMNEELSVSRTLEEKRRRDGKNLDGSLSSKINSKVKKSQDIIEGRTIGRDSNHIMSGNIIIQGMDTSLVELARNMEDMYQSQGGDSSSSNVNDKNYVYEWATLESSVTVNHNLGKFPSVTIVDTAGSEIIGDITYVNENSVTLSFSAPMRGKAYFN